MANEKINDKEIYGIMGTNKSIMESCSDSNDLSKLSFASI